METAGKSWNLKVTFFQAWKVLESDLGRGKLWKVMEIQIASVTNFSMISQ